MAIHGKKRIELTIDSVLARIQALDIYSFYMPHKNWKLNEVTNSPFKEDKSPSFIIGNKYGEVGHFAFNEPDKKGDCFSFVKQLYNLPNLDSVLRLIDKEMNLGIANGTDVQKLPIQSINKPQEVTKRNTFIQIVTRKFTNEELAYWNTYYQDLEDLRKDNIYSIKNAYLNRKLLSLSELRFGYFYNGFWKIYQPTQKKRGKWISNVPLTYLDGKENIKDCDTAWVTKSKKDKLVLRKLYNCVISTQNESVACFSQENVDFIKENSKKQIILYDSDEAGVKSCQEITKRFSFGYCNPPRKYLDEGIKDFSDLAKAHGLKAVEEVLKEKGII